MRTTVIRELKKIGITHEFIRKLAQGKADQDAYEPAGRLLAKVINKVWKLEEEPTPDEDVETVRNPPRRQLK